MEDRRRTRSQGPPSMSEENELIQWGSLQDPVRIEREHTEACRLAREANTVNNLSQKLVETSKISQAVSKEASYTDHTPQSVRSALLPNRVRSCQTKEKIITSSILRPI